MSLWVAVWREELRERKYINDCPKSRLINYLSVSVGWGVVRGRRGSGVSVMSSFNFFFVSNFPFCLHSIIKCFRVFFFLLLFFFAQLVLTNQFATFSPCFSTVYNFQRTRIFSLIHFFNLGGAILGKLLFFFVWLNCRVCFFIWISRFF